MAYIGKSLDYIRYVKAFLLYDTKTQDMQEKNQDIAVDSLNATYSATEAPRDNRLVVTKQKLYEAGTCYGHYIKMWNPKMRSYLYVNSAHSRLSGPQRAGNIHIISIAKTQRAIDMAYRLVYNLTKQGVSFLFVGTKPQARDTITAQAQRTNSPYVSQRWLGGTLTNSRTIFQRVRELERLEQLRDRQWSGYTKKEGLSFEKRLAKLERNLQGIRNMRTLPQVMIVADPLHDDIAVKEARKKGVKVIGIIDSNADPYSVDFGIPANDDASRSINLIITLLADAIIEARGETPIYAYKSAAELELPEEMNKNQDGMGHSQRARRQERDSQHATVGDRSYPPRRRPSTTGLRFAEPPANSAEPARENSAPKQ